MSRLRVQTLSSSLYATGIRWPDHASAGASPPTPWRRQVSALRIAVQSLRVMRLAGRVCVLYGNEVISSLAGGYI